MINRWTVAIALTSLLAVGCDDGGSDNSGAGQATASVDFDSFVAASQESEEETTVTEAEIDPDVVEYSGSDTVSAGLYLDGFEGDDDQSDPDYVMCSEETFFNACEECACSECAPLAEACALSEGCMELIGCGMQTACFGVACFEACSEVMSKYGGAVGKASDMATKLSGCITQKCFSQCAAGIGSDPFNPEDEDQEGEGN